MSPLGDICCAGEFELKKSIVFLYISPPREDETMGMSRLAAALELESASRCGKSLTLISYGQC